MAAYYNEHDPFAAQWLRNLIYQDLIPAGDVDERSITEVQPDDIRGYTQHHFFAGIGGWSRALRLAGWPDNRPVCTGSCPCQPFSAAGKGKGKGKADERHLLPVWLRLIRECRFPVVFGEQVERAVAHGWLDDAFNGLEAEGYTCGASVLPACSVGAAHKRERIWFVAHSERGTATGGQRGAASGSGSFHGVATNYVGNASGGNSLVGNSLGAGLERFGGHEYIGAEPGRIVSEPNGSIAPANTSPPVRVKCPDEKFRPVEPGICLLADGFPNRVGILRGFGNAIVPQVAAEFIMAAMEA